MPVHPGRGFTSLVHCDIIYKFVTSIFSLSMFICLNHLKATLREIVTLAFKSVDESVILQIKPFWRKFGMVPLFLGISPKGILIFCEFFGSLLLGVKGLRGHE